MRWSYFIVSLYSHWTFQYFLACILIYLPVHNFVSLSLTSVLVEETEGCHVSCFARIWGQSYLDFWPYIWKGGGM